MTKPIRLIVTKPIRLVVTRRHAFARAVPRRAGGGGGGGGGGGDSGGGSISPAEIGSISPVEIGSISPVEIGSISPVEIVVVSPAAGLRADAVPGEDHVAVWISSLGDGTYRAIFQPVRSGRLVIFFRSSEGAAPLGDSPYFLKVLPAAAAASACKVRAAGPLLTAPHALGTALRFSVAVCDTYGNARPAAQDRLEVLVSGWPLSVLMMASLGVLLISPDGP